jgi:hypothetical protein
MSNFLEFVLKKIGCDPSRLGEAFAEKLTQQEELMLCKLDDEICICVDRVLDAALHGANASNNNEIMLDSKNRNRVTYLTAMRCEIQKLIAERGSFGPWREGMN